MVRSVPRLPCLVDDASTIVSVGGVPVCVCVCVCLCMCMWVYVCIGCERVCGEGDWEGVCLSIDEPWAHGCRTRSVCDVLTRLAADMCRSLTCSSTNPAPGGLVFPEGTERDVIQGLLLAGSAQKGECLLALFLLLFAGRARMSQQGVILVDPLWVRVSTPCRRSCA